MLVIEFGFPAGRYHATPWGHNVNEGVVEWPPSPYRLARALYDLCKRRRSEWDDERLAAVIKVLESPVGFDLPPATTSHTRSYLNSNTKSEARSDADKQKVFDAFVAIDRRKRLLAAFDSDPPREVRNDLNELLEEMNYFGRSESWINARIASLNDISFNCIPTASSEERRGTELVRVACLRPEDEYGLLPQQPTAASSARKKCGGESLSWIDALGMSTAELLKDGWSEPPSQKMVDYLRSVSALRSRPRRHRRTLESRFKVANYALHSTVLPRITDAVPFAERVHSLLMGIHKRVSGGDPSAVSSLFSGKDSDGKPLVGHEHVFILPLDEDLDGRIDRLVIKSVRRFEVSELDALDQLRKVWQTDGRPDVQLVLSSLSAETPWKPARRWQSVTPFVTARHHRRGRGHYFEWLTAEVRRECGHHGLPEPESIEWIDRTRGSGHQIRWMEFVRSRKGRRPFRGHGAILTFAEPVQGPVVLGALSHFGLGLFVPADAEGE